MRPSTVLANQHFLNKVLPRKLEEQVRPGSNNVRARAGAPSFRKARRDESGGQLFSLTDFSFDSLAQFGLGVSVYLIQLGIVGLLTFLCGCILLPSIVSFAQSSYGVFWDHDPRLLGSAACDAQVVITGITRGCEESETSCSASYREGCELPEATIISDIVMACFVALVLFFNMGIDEIEDVLDEAVQTAQDYSVVVTDPEPDATDPEEWRVFFERYGRVRNVSVTKKNRGLHKLLLRKHLIMREIDPRQLSRVRDEVDLQAALNHLKSRSDSFNPSEIIEESESWTIKFRHMLGFSRGLLYHLKHLCAVNKLIEKASEKEYTACRVFVSFETEMEQRLCLKECATSHLEAILDISSSSKTRCKFRGVSVLNVSESAEPNNIQWENLESTICETIARRVACWMFSFGVIAALFVAIAFVLARNPSMVSVLISVINICLPAIFIKVTEFEAHIDEDDRQNSLLFKLYGAKLLTSVIFLYISTGWDDFLDSESVIAIINVQLGACFSAPLFKLFDPMGVFYRWIVGPAVSTSQSQLNKYWEGSAFMLADRYTEISKVIFISFFYSLLTPVALYIAVLSCLAMFAIDRYLLFRKTKTPPMLDATMAKSLREHALFAIGVKVWVSCRFIYGWPMDEAYKASDSTFVKVDKQPHLSMWALHEQEWHSSSQRHLFIVYKWIAITIMCFVVFIIVIWPLIDFVKDFFYNSYEEEESSSSDKVYSRVASIIAYCPVVKNKTEVFIAADTSRMLSRHSPEVITCFPGEETNLGLLLREEDRSRLLARVVWYGDPDVKADLEANNTILEGDRTTSAGGILSTAFKRRFGASKKSRGIETVLESNYRLVDRAVKNKIKITVENDLADVAHIDMALSMYDQADGESKHDQTEEVSDSKGGVENILGMSRIKKSVLQRQRRKNSKVDIAPQTAGDIDNDENKNSEKHVFMRDEVYLLRQMRKEMLSLNLMHPTVKGNVDSTGSFVDFNKFLYLIQKNAPDAISSSKNDRRHVVSNLRDSNETKNQNIKFSRTLLRRIYVKFIPLQESLGSTGESCPNLVNWPVFVAFVQSGTAVELASL